MFSFSGKCFNRKDFFSQINQKVSVQTSMNSEASRTSSNDPPHLLLRIPPVRHFLYSKSYDFEKVNIDQAASVYVWLAVRLSVCLSVCMSA